MEPAREAGFDCSRPPYRLGAVWPSVGAACRMSVEPYAVVPYRIDMLRGTTVRPPHWQSR